MFAALVEGRAQADNGDVGGVISVRVETNEPPTFVPPSPDIFPPEPVFPEQPEPPDAPYVPERAIIGEPVCAAPHITFVYKPYTLHCYLL